MSACDAPSDLSAFSIPEGFEPMRRPDGQQGFVQHCQGIYLNSERRIVAARVLPVHLNALRIAHGGFLATLADTAFGALLRLAGDFPQPPVTIELSVDYLRPARLDSWIEAHIEVHKLGRNLCRASLSLMDGERQVVRAKGTFMANPPGLRDTSRTDVGAV
ncbi:PaaI family thioesterase [Pseudomonas sp. PDM18]|uniref:PaaI family thioesterase n=1 Tax=Pseudomonas sp. PDM18 TaxID=2769253 RepID=UPI001782C21C|nr:PaaI family thioesterase [Pseudomonas sp. PDM18]MBD9676558.1 PaaI family thioesterase [Pseudomonas sp. PDM18]